MADGADLVGVAGGDGSQALVAGRRRRARSAVSGDQRGHRNHFALDLGLNREDATAGLGDLVDCVELRVDLGLANGQPFVNNARQGTQCAAATSPRSVPKT